MCRNACLAAALLAAWALAESASFRAAADAPAERPVIRLNRPAEAGTPATIDVAGLDPADLAKLAGANLEPGQWNALLAVRVVTGNAAEDRDRPAMLGSYRVEKGLLRFEPRFPLAPGVRYRAAFDPSRLPGRTGKAEPVVAEFSLPRAKAAATVVEHVYPSRDLLPENQLKFYLHFSAPMSRGDVYRHVHLLDAAGKEVELPFLELGEELWDPSGKRFTLFFDPGRIKRGLKPREDLGPALEEGKRYTLVIDGRWEDAQGVPLKESFRKPFRVGAPDDEPIEPKAWKLQAPAAGKAGPLTVAFPESLDHALLHRLLWVVDAAGRKVEGAVRVSDEETRWHFTPGRPWQAGAYRLVADVTLEDLAGNKIGRPFEVDVFRPIQREVKTQTVEVPFEVRP